MSAQEKSSLFLLEQATELGHKEFVALYHGNLDNAETLFAQRNDLIHKALALGDQGNPTEYRAALQKASSIHAKLLNKAKEERGILLKSLNRTKAEQKRLKAYHKAVQHAFF